MVKAVIFDFDGTLADSFHVILDVFKNIARYRGVLTPEVIEDLRNKNTRDILRFVGVKRWHLPQLLINGRREMAGRMDEVKPFPHIAPLLKELSGTYQICILSTNAALSIENFLDTYRLSDYITDIRGSIGLMGKTRALRSLLKERGLSASECVYVGDETRDIESARKAGLRCIAVTWGFNGRRILAEHQPAALADKPQDIVVICREFAKD